MTAFIYGLRDPRTHRTRYIGKSMDPTGRMRAHLRAKGNHHRSCWVRSLLRQGLEPELVVLETVEDREWQDKERWWIACLEKMGADLVNGSRGGVGGSKKGHQVSPEGRARITAGTRRVCKGVPLSEEHRQKLSEAHRGKALSEEHKRKIGAKSKGRKHSIESRQKMSRVRTGETRSKKTCERIAASKAGTYPAFYNRVTEEVIPAGVNLSKLCRERGFYRQGLWAVIHGKVTSYKNWVLSSSVDNNDTLAGGS